MSEYPDIIIDRHIFTKICLKLQEIESMIKELHSLMDKARVSKVEPYGTTGEES